MRQARIKVGEDREVGYYHCISRVVGGNFVFGDAERERFVALMREYEEFCEVRVLTFCVMSNHFHVLLEVPKVPEEKPPADKLLGKLRKLTGFQDVSAAELELDAIRQSKNTVAELKWCERYWARMWDVSAYMKILKQRFTQWFNRVQGRRGTLWEERFKSVLVDGAGEALVTMAAYIDRMVEDPKP